MFALAGLGCFMVVSTLCLLVCADVWLFCWGEGGLLCFDELLGWG